MVAATPSARPKTSAAASTKRCQRWLKSGTRRTLLRCRAGGVALTCLGLVDPLQHDHRDLARRLLPVVPETRVDVGVLLVQALVLVPIDHLGPGLELLATRLHGDDRVGLQVVVPGRVGWRAALGGEDHVVTRVRGVDEWGRALLAGFGALGGEDQNVAPEERTAGRLAVGADVLDQVAVEVVKAAHPLFIPSRRLGHSPRAGQNPR